MVDLRLHYGAAALCVAATLLAGCGGSQPLIGNPGAIPPGRAITQQAAHVPMRERSGQSFSVAYSFRGQSDGAQPQGNLIFDTSGALLGTTASGGSYLCGFYHNEGCGTVFKLTPSQSGYTENVLYSFLGRPSSGAWPWAGLVSDANGALYGTTSSTEGANGCGTVFRLARAGLRYTESTIHAFRGRNCDSGERPYAGVIFGKDGSLYGTTYVGGRAGDGVAFKLKPSGSGYAGRIMHSFDGSDGEEPFGGLTLGKDGALYGTTRFGGATQKCGFYYTGCGAVFKLTPMGRSRYTETIIHSFVLSDGEGPFGGLVLDNKGALYGTTSEGGSGTCSGFTGCGTVFKLTPAGTGYTESVLYRFAGISQYDGQYPIGKLVLDKKGAIYGTTYWGGIPSCSCGTVFKLTPSGSGYKESVAHTFTGADGAEPRAGLLFDKEGALYGTTSGGGAYGQGIVFKMQP